jgi:hypothetical protein
MIKVFTEKVALLLQGKIPVKIDAEKLDNEDEREFSLKFNQLIDFMQEIHEFIIPLSKGNLHDIKVQPNNFLASPFKELHSKLAHLTWQATAVAKGDYNQRIDFMGDFSEAFNGMVAALDQNEKLLKKKIDELEQALLHITKLESFLNICSNCKRVKLDGTDPEKQGDWVQIESYIGKRTKTRFSHGICPECMAKLYPDFVKQKSKE